MDKTPIPRPRKKSRVVTFRLPDDEFAQFQAFYSAGTARSISDLVRQAVGQLLGGGPAHEVSRALVEQVARIDEKVLELESRVEDLRRQWSSLEQTSPE